MTSGSARFNFLAKAGATSLLCALLAQVITGCTSTTVPGNQPLSRIDDESGYRRMGAAKALKLGDSIIILSFSGGGTRASALSYGVMQELRDTTFIDRDRELRALDAVDSISAVSGGSFTAAYYGAFRERLFEDYEDEFLRRGVQSGLVARLLRPVNWIGNMFSDSDRTEMAIRYYDDNIFRGATFKDIRDLGPPFIEINATELTTGLRFNFTQERFDFLCSELDSFPVARAVTASSAVPGVFPSVVIENHSSQCDISQTRAGEMLARVQGAADSESEAYLADRVTAYLDEEERPYIHLVDGGISDNLGLRAIIDRMDHLSEHQFSILEHHLPRNIVLVLVNAEVRRDRHIEQQQASPSLATTMATLTNVQMHRHNLETMDLLRKGIEDFERKVDEAGMQTAIYFTEISFDQVVDPKLNDYLNSLPTTLELADDDVDRLIAAGRFLLRHNPAFRKFRNDNAGSLVPGAVANDVLCRQFGYTECPERASD